MTNKGIMTYWALLLDSLSFPVGILFTKQMNITRPALVSLTQPNLLALKTTIFLSANRRRRDLKNFTAGLTENYNWHTYFPFI